MKNVTPLVLSPRTVELLARAIRESGWDDESIAAGAFIMSHIQLVTRARAGELKEIAPDEQIAFASLAAFFGVPWKVGD